MKAVKRYKLPVINKYEGCDVQRDKYNEHCYMSYMKVKRVNPKSSHRKEKSFSVSLILHLYEMTDAH